MARWDAAWHQRLEREIGDLPFQKFHVRSAIRRRLAQDPIACALIYFRHHLKDQHGNVTFSEAHYEWARIALQWAEPTTEPQQCRDAVIAPRETGKTTWFFLILPMWAAINGCRKFCVAFADTTGQAETHLSTFKRELDENALLRADHPDLCTPAKRRSGMAIADRQGMLHARNGFTFAARGIDASSLGLKVDAVRPDLLILDDVEPDEASYSPTLAVKRLGTITDAVFPLNIYAAVVMVGTVTMPGSIMHQLVKYAAGRDTEPWIADQKIRVHHHLPILRDDQGRERSLWPEKWSLTWLMTIRHTRSYQKNYANDPLARDSLYWLKTDFRYSRPENVTRTMLVIDPAVTARRTSDFTGVCVGSWAPAEGRSTRDHPGKVWIREALGVRLTGAPLRTFVAEKILPRFPEIRYILVETNQGGDLWWKPGGVLYGLGVKVGSHWSSESKEVRFARELDHWQRGHVEHEREFATLEEQCIGFPNHAYDDVADAAVALVSFFLTAPYKKVKVSTRTEVYV